MNEKPKRSKAILPTNQKALYHTYAKVFAALWDDEISVDEAKEMNNSLGGMVKIFALETKRAQVLDAYERRVESTAFDDTTKTASGRPNLGMADDSNWPEEQPRLGESNNPG